MNELEIPPSVHEIVEALKQATGYNLIRFGKGCFVIEFDITHRQQVKGLEIKDESFGLAYEEFKELPICFMVHVGSAIHQYFTVGGRPHRPDDRPSYIAIDPATSRSIRRWNWGGLLHRPVGPAKEQIREFSVAETGIDNHLKHEWEHMSLEWYQEGVRTRYPAPSQANIHRGWRIVNAKTGALNSPRDDLAAWGADHVEIVWDSPVHDETQADMFMPLRLELVNPVEFYEDGKMVRRECDLADFTWYRRGDTLEPETITKFNEVAKGMITDFGLWQAPFYQDEGHEFVLLTEFDRVGRDE